MTKVERHDDIQDNINFLNSIYSSLKLDQLDFKLNVLGFSQGGPTATRWVINSEFKLNSLILWGCDLPNDCLEEDHRLRWSDFRLKYVIGKNDEYIDEEKILHEKEKLTNYGLVYDFHLFEGGHSIESSTLKKLI